MNFGIECVTEALLETIQGRFDGSVCILDKTGVSDVYLKSVSPQKLFYRKNVGEVGICKPNDLLRQHSAKHLQLLLEACRAVPTIFARERQ